MFYGAGAKRVGSAEHPLNLSVAKQKRVPSSELPMIRLAVWSSALLTIKTKNNKAGVNRLAVIVPAKKIKSAAHRHRIKRQILARARLLPPKNNDYLFIFNSSVPPTVKEWAAEFDKIQNTI